MRAVGGGGSALLPFPSLIDSVVPASPDPKQMQQMGTYEVDPATAPEQELRLRVSPPGSQRSPHPVPLRCDDRLHHDRPVHPHLDATDGRTAKLDRMDSRHNYAIRVLKVLSDV